MPFGPPNQAKGSEKGQRVCQGLAASVRLGFSLGQFPRRANGQGKFKHVTRMQQGILLWALGALTGSEKSSDKAGFKGSDSTWIRNV